MILKSIIVFAVLDNGKIHQLLLDKDTIDIIKSNIHYFSMPKGITCSNIDFSEVMQLPENK
jgi:hypothetical protein